MELPLASTDFPFVGKSLDVLLGVFFFNFWFFYRTYFCLFSATNLYFYNSNVYILHVDIIVVVLNGAIGENWKNGCLFGSRNLTKC